MENAAWVAASSTEPVTTTRYTNDDRVTALAGIYQAAKLAHELANRGDCASAPFSATRDAVLNLEPPSVEDVFGGTCGVALGLRTVSAYLDKASQQQIEVSRYVVSLMHLGDRLRRNRGAMNALGEALSALSRRTQHFELGASVLNEQLADVYQTHISPLGPRIMVRGEPLHLRNASNAARVRAALLGGIRACVLWRQAGGGKWQLLLQRRKLVETARALLDGCTIADEA